MMSLSDKSTFCFVITSKILQIVPKILLHIYTNKINGHAFQEMHYKKCRDHKGYIRFFARREFVKVISFKILYWKLLRNDSEAFLFASTKAFWTVSLSMLKSETNYLKPLARCFCF